MNEIVNKFQKHLIVNENSASTIENYTGRVKRLLKFTNGVENINEESVVKFLLEVKKTVSKKTLNCYKDSLAVFLRFIKKDIPMPKRAKIFRSLPKYFTLKFFEKSIIPMVDLVSRKPIRDKILLYFAFWTGLRKMELTKLKRENFNLEERTAKVIIPKTKEERIVFYTKRVKDLLEVYFSLEPEDKNALNICPSTLESLLKRLNPYFKEIHLHPHKFRHCVSEDTQILTSIGWKTYKNLKKREKVFSYNLKINQIELVALKNLHIYRNYKGKMYNIKNKYLDILVTLEHKNIFKIAKEKQLNYKRWTEWNKKWKLLTISEMKNRPNKRLIKHLVSGNYSGKKSIGKWKAYLLGLILTDGNIDIQNREKSPNITISQSLSANPKKCTKIKNVFQKSNLKYSSHKQKPQINRFSGKLYQMQIFRILKSSQSWIWDYLTKNNEPILSSILELNKTELKEIFNAMMLADGSRQEFCDQNPKTIELIRILSTLSGYRTIVSTNNLENKYRTYIHYKNNCNVSLNEIKKVDYRGIVWCPSTKNRTFIAKRNGKIFITGNSFAAHFLMQGGDISDLKEFLGHKSIQSTMRYAGLKTDDRKKKYDKFMK